MNKKEFTFETTLLGWTKDEKKLLFDYEGRGFFLEFSDGSKFDLSKLKKLAKEGEK